MEQDGVVPGAPASPEVLSAPASPEAPPPPPAGVVPVLPVPNAPPPLRRIMFRLHQNGNYAVYSAEGGARIGQMMTVFCNSENIEIETVAFLHNGFRVFPFHTVDQWEMEDLDVVDVIPHPMGGGDPGKAAAMI